MTWKDVLDLSEYELEPFFADTEEMNNLEAQFKIETFQGWLVASGHFQFRPLGESLTEFTDPRTTKSSRAKDDRDLLITYGPSSIAPKKHTNYIVGGFRDKRICLSPRMKGKHPAGSDKYTLLGRSSKNIKLLLNLTLCGGIGVSCHRDSTRLNVFPVNSWTGDQCTPSRTRSNAVGLAHGPGKSGFTWMRCTNPTESFVLS